jgi:hypothetical protein
MCVIRMLSGMLVTTPMVWHLKVLIGEAVELISFCY